MFNIALVGLGGICVTQHAPSLLQYSRDVHTLTLSVCDPNAAQREAWLKNFGATPSFASCEELIATKRPDAAVVCVPPEVSCKVTSIFLKAKIPVLCEKPPGNTAMETRQLRDTAGTVLHAVAFNRRHSPYLKELMRVAAKEVPGTPTLIHCEFERCKRYEEDFTTTAIHGLDALRSIGGDLARVQVSARTVEGSKLFRAMTVQGRFNSGALMQMNILPTTGRAVERYHVIGENVTVSAEVAMPGTIDAGCVRVLREKKQTFLSTEKELNLEDAPENVRCGFYGQIETFLNAARNGGSPGTSFGEALQSMELMEFLRNANDGDTWKVEGAKS